MTPEEAEVLFEQEYCSRHRDTPAKLEVHGSSTYFWEGLYSCNWQCPLCGRTWVTKGSPMAAYNLLNEAASYQRRGIPAEDRMCFDELLMYKGNL